MEIKKLDIRNRVFTLPARLFNILDFNPEKLDIQKEGNDEIGIYYIDYDLDPFCLVIDDLNGYFEENNGDKYLTLIIDDKEDKYVKVWEEIKKLINNVANDEFSDYNKDHKMIRFDSDDDLPLGSMVKIHSYPQVFLDYCLYEV